MNAKIILAGVAIAAMTVGAASAKTHSASGGSYAAPSQPVPYSQLDGYMKASPKQRTAMMSGATADTGTAADTASTGGASTGAMAGGTSPSAPMSTGATPGGAMSSETMPSTSGAATGAMTPGAPSATPATPPK